ncbi:hypothetical protein IE077_004204, partial [Cardiosporidium cionae]
MDALIKVVLSMPRLRRLALKNCNLKNENLFKILNFFSKKANRSRLAEFESLDLSGNCFDNKAAKYLSEWLITQNVHLAALDVSSNKMGFSLSLLGCNHLGSHQGDAALFSYVSSLKSLSFSNCEFIKKVRLDHLLFGEWVEFQQKLTFLYVHPPLLYTLHWILKQILETVGTTLEHLDISHNHQWLTSMDIIHFITSLYKSKWKSKTAQGHLHLKSFLLAYNELSPEVFSSLSRCLMLEACTLEILDISGNPVGNKNTSKNIPNYFESFLMALQGTKKNPPSKLQSLILKSCGLSNLELQGLAGALFTNEKNLKYLDISENNFTKDLSKAFLEVIPHSGLKELKGISLKEDFSQPSRHSQELYISPEALSSPLKHRDFFEWKEQTEMDKVAIVSLEESPLLPLKTSAFASPKKERTEFFDGSPQPYITDTFSFDPSSNQNFVDEKGELSDLLPLPIDPSQLDYIRDSLCLLGLQWLRIAFPPTPQNHVGKSLLLPLLLGPSHAILLAMKSILRGWMVLTLPDVRLLEELSAQPDLDETMQYLLSIVMEELPMVNKNYRFQRFNALDFDDKVGTAGSLPFFDGGYGCQAMHPPEYRVLWLRKHGRSVIQPKHSLYPLSTSPRHLLSGNTAIDTPIESPTSTEPLFTTTASHTFYPLSNPSLDPSFLSPTSLDPLSTFFTSLLPQDSILARRRHSSPLLPPTGASHRLPSQKEAPLLGEIFSQKLPLPPPSSSFPLPTHFPPRWQPIPPLPSIFSKKRGRPRKAKEWKDPSWISPKRAFKTQRDAIPPVSCRGGRVGFHSSPPATLASIFLTPTLSLATPEQTMGLFSIHPLVSVFDILRPQLEQWALRGIGAPNPSYVSSFGESTAATPNSSLYMEKVCTLSQPFSSDFPFSPTSAALSMEDQEKSKKRDFTAFTWDEDWLSTIEYYLKDKTLCESILLSSTAKSISLSCKCREILIVDMQMDAAL